MISRYILCRTVAVATRTGYFSARLACELPLRSSTVAPLRPVRAQHLQYRSFATAKSEADIIIEKIQDQYATAKDEFEIAVEETEKKTVYAAEDRAAAAEECAKLKQIYEEALERNTPDVANEIKSRAGQRIRELDEAIKGLEQSAKEGD